MLLFLLSMKLILALTLSHYTVINSSCKWQRGKFRQKTDHFVVTTINNMNAEEYLKEHKFQYVLPSVFS